MYFHDILIILQYVFINLRFRPFNSKIVGNADLLRWQTVTQHLFAKDPMIIILSKRRTEEQHAKQQN